MGILVSGWKTFKRALFPTLSFGSCPTYCACSSDMKCSTRSLTTQFCPRSPGTTLLPSSVHRWARRHTRRGSLADLWTCNTSSCRQTPGAGSAAMTTTLRTCRDPSWRDKWPKSAWWGRETGWKDEWRQEEDRGGLEGEYCEWFCAAELHCYLQIVTHCCTCWPSPLDCSQ